MSRNMSTDEKLPSHVGYTLSPFPSSAPTDVDDAWKFLDANRHADVEDEPVKIVAVRRKIG